MGKINKFVGHENDEEIATLKYNDIELRIGYTYIHALRSIFSTADFSSGDSLRDHSIFAKIIDNIEQEMGKNNDKKNAKLPDTKEEEVEKSCFTCKYAIEHYNLETKKTRCELFKNWVYHEDKLEQCDKWVSYKLRELKEEVKECGWKNVDNEVWETGCGKTIYQTDNGLSLKEMNYCCKCGKKIKEVAK